MTFVRLNNRPYRLDNWFKELENSFEPFSKKAGSKVPAVNILEDEKGYYLELPAPGRTKEAFAISVDQDVLKIQYEAPQTKDASNKKTIRSEFALESFTRSFSLDQKIDSNLIEANYVNGILNLFLPKKKTIQPEQKKIQVQ